MYFVFNNQHVAVNVADMPTLNETVVGRFRRSEGFALATVNLDHLVKLAADAAFLSAYRAQDLIVADGRPIKWLSQLAGRPVEVMPGSDLVLPLCSLAAREGVKVALVGSADAVLTQARAGLMSQVEGLEVAYMRAPSRGFDPKGDEARQILTELDKQGIGLCFIALGAPKQEQFAQLGRQLAPGVGFASIGAGLDFVAGHQTRAPRWVRSLAMEWFWRMLSDPQRLVPRYAKCFAILPRQIRQAWRIRRQHGVEAAEG